jgi:hypothetical protein
MSAYFGSHPFCKLQKWCTRLAAISDKVYQLFAPGRLFSSGTPASSMVEILLKVALKHNKSIKPISEGD